MTSCVASTMMSPVPTSKTETSYPTPRTKSTAHVLAALKSNTKHRVVRNEISPASTVANLPPRPLGSKQFTFTEEEDQVEDKALSFLERTGHLSQVAGSQSMLSQELLDNDADQQSQSEPPSQFSSISSKSPKSIARRYGILTQEMDEGSVVTAHDARSIHSFQTPPRKSSARKIVTDQTSRIPPLEHGEKASLEDEALNCSQPSLTLSQLEAAANEPNYFGSQQSFASASFSAKGGNSRNTSLISLCNAAERHMYVPLRAFSTQGAQQRTKRKYARKLPRSESATAHGPPPMKKAKGIRSSNSSTSSKADPDEAMSDEIKWLGFSSKRREVSADQKDIAKQAADLAHRIMQGEDDLAKGLLLSMALNRDSPRQPPSKWPDQGPVPEGFVWAHYPPLETLLKDNMEEYYNLSMAKCQSSKQQLFNNNLVDRVRDEAGKHGWNFPTDRRTLRDRIRCYFKTHLQNAKKRLRTLLRNPTKRANAKNLVKLMEIIPDTPQVLGDVSTGTSPAAVTAEGDVKETKPAPSVPAQVKREEAKEEEQTTAKQEDAKAEELVPSIDEDPKEEEAFPLSQEKEGEDYINI